MVRWPFIVKQFTKFQSFWNKNLIQRTCRVLIRPYAIILQDDIARFMYPCFVGEKNVVQYTCSTICKFQEPIGKTYSFSQSVRFNTCFTCSQYGWRCISFNMRYTLVGFALSLHTEQKVWQWFVDTYHPFHIRCNVSPFLLSEKDKKFMLSEKLCTNWSRNFVLRA